MKTIEIRSNGWLAQFTTKSVTIEGKEYLYSHISELRHSEPKHVYGFKCDGEVVMFPYAEKDTQILKAIFSQVEQMHRKPAAGKPAVKEESPAAPQEEIPSDVPADVPAAPEEAPAAVDEVPPVPAEETPVEEIPATEVTPVEEIPAAGETNTEATTGEVSPEDSDEKTPALSPKELKKREKEQRKAEKEAARREKQAQKAAAKSEGSVTTYATAESAAVDPDVKTARFKKAIIVFVIILAVFALLGVAYYFFVGPASDPQIGPNTTDQTQYNDIDDMINDLEN